MDSEKSSDDVETSSEIDHKTMATPKAPPSSTTHLTPGSTPAPETRRAASSWWRARYQELAFHGTPALPISSCGKSTPPGSIQGEVLSKPEIASPCGFRACVYWLTIEWRLPMAFGSTCGWYKPQGYSARAEHAGKVQRARAWQAFASKGIASVLCQSGSEPGGMGAGATRNCNSLAHNRPAKAKTVKTSPSFTI